MTAIFRLLKKWGLGFKNSLLVMYFAWKHPRTPAYLKALLAFIACYVVSPVDLVTDLVPVAGYIDDIFMATLGFTLIARLLPQDVLAECRSQANNARRGIQALILAAFILILAILAALIYFLVSR